MAKTQHIKNNSPRAVTLFDGTILVPGEATQVEAETLEKLKAGKHSKKHKKSQLDDLMSAHDLELVSGDDGDEEKTPAVDTKPHAHKPAGK